MTKADLIEEVSRVVELTRKESEVIVETIFDSVVESLKTGDKVEIRGFGSFRTRDRGPRRGQNPRTGEPVLVPAKRVAYFKPGKELREYFTELAELEPARSADEAGEVESGEGAAAESSGGSTIGSTD